jgi:hypothetical protein
LLNRRGEVMKGFVQGRIASRRLTVTDEAGWFGSRPAPDF